MGDQSKLLMKNELNKSQLCNENEQNVTLFIHNELFHFSFTVCTYLKFEGEFKTICTCCKITKWMENRECKQNLNLNVK